MEKEFVIYPLALRMKALGYDEPCFAYFLNSILQYPAWEKDYSYFNEMSDINPSLKKHEHVLAPTWQSAFRWFKEEHFLSSDIAERMRDGKRITHFFISELKTNNKFFKTIPSKLFTDYEDAQLACLEKLIEIVEEK